MTIGKEIKVVLTLDDSGFTVKTKLAKDNVKLLEAGLNDFGNSAVRIEGDIKKLGGEVSAFNSGFASINKTLLNVASQIERTAEKLNLVGSSASKSLSKLDDAQVKSAKVAKETSDQFANARIASLRAEIEADDKIVSKRADMYRKLKQEESNYANQAMAKRLLLETSNGAVQDPKTKRFTSRTPIEAEASRLESVATAAGIAALQADQAIKKIQAERVVRLQNIEAIKQEVAALSQANEAKKARTSVEDFVGKNNAAEVKRILGMKLAADKEAARAEKDSANDLGRLKKSLLDQELRDKKEATRQALLEDKEAARSLALQQRENAQQIAKMWKTLAQGYGAAKIKDGLVASVDTSDKFQREQLMASSLNLSKEETADITTKAWEDSKALKFVSALDMIRARMAAIGGLGENNVKVIDSLLQHASMVAHNIMVVTGDKSKDGFENMIRNLLGVVEARQQTKDPEAAKRTFDLIQKMVLATGRKLDVADLETFMRRDATGADKISDEGLAKMIAFLDQAKVSGGHGGGAGAGVSTVGTMVKMFQKMANGGLQTVAGATQFAEAGVMDLSNMDGKSGKNAMRALRQGGLNIAQLANKDPVEALEKISQAALSFMTRPENLKKYFPGGDSKSPEAIKDAFMKFAIGTGWSTNATSMLTTAGNKDAMERAHAQAKTLMNSDGAEAMNTKVMATYAGNVDKFTSAMENLKTSLGTSVLPLVTQVANALSMVIDSMSRYFKDNSTSAFIVTLLAGFAGLTLAFRSLMGMFGAVGSLGNIFRSLIPGVASLTTGATTAAAGMSALNAASASSAITSVGAGGTIMGVARGIGAGFMRLIPIVGALATLFTLVDWIANMEVGGAKIITWVIGFGERVFTGFQNMWLRVKALFADESGKVKLAAERAQNDIDLQNGLKANGVQTDKEKKFVSWDQRHADSMADARDQLAADEQAKNFAKNKAKRDAELKKKAEDDARKAKNDAAAQAANQKKLNDLTSGKSGSDARPERHADPLTKALEEAKGRIDSDKIKLDALKLDAQGLEALRLEVAAEVEGKRKAGDYNKDQKKPVAANDPRIAQLKDELFNQRLLEEQIKAVTFAKERTVATEGEVANAMDRLTGDNVTKQTDAFRALERELQRAEVRLGAGGKAFSQWQKEKASALYNQALSDGLNYSGDLSDKTKSNKLSNIDNDRERKAAELALAAEIENAKFQMLLDNESKTHAEKVARITEEIADESAKNSKIAEMKESFDALQKIQMQKHSEFVKSQAEKDAKEMRTPLEKMADQWKDGYQQLEDAQSGWANGFVSMITGAMETGKFKFRDFIKSMLMDIATVQLKQSVAQPLTNAISAGTKALGGYLFGSPKSEGGAAGADGSESVKKLSEASELGSSALQKMAQEGAAQATTGLLQQAVAGASETAATGVFASSLNMATVALGEFASSLAASGAASVGGGGGGFGSILSSFFSGGGGAEAESGLADIGSSLMFAANGGILTQYGAMPLRKYAKGGIANSPQLAIYGEAGPEAYVPLPDGRSIPVTMSGGGQSQAAAPAVTVNVVNQSGQPVAAQSGQTRFDGKSYILDVVLTAAHQAGNFRSSMKDALK